MSDEKNYNVFTPATGVPIKAWTKGVPLEEQARKQLLNVAAASLHLQVGCGHAGRALGHRSTVGSVIPTKGAIIPAAVGVDIGCGMMAVQTDLNAPRSADHLKGIRSAIEKAVRTGVPIAGPRRCRRVARDSRTQQ